MNDGGTARAIAFNGIGTVNLNSAATSLVAGTQININAAGIQNLPTAGLVNNYRFDEGSGTTANDSGFAGVIGTLVGTGVGYSSVAKIGASAMNFTAANSYVQISNSAADRLLGGFTVSAWIDPSSLNNSGATIFSTQNNGTAGFALSLNKSEASVSIGGTSTGFATFSLPFSLTTGKWSLITVSVSPTGAVVYLNDGTSASGGGSNSTTYSGTPVLETATNFATIGNQEGSSGFSSTNQFLGEIDDLRVYNTALSRFTNRQTIRPRPGGHHAEFQYGDVHWCRCAIDS